MTPQKSAESESVAVVNNSFRLIADLMQRNSDDQRLILKLLTSGSGATDRLDVQSLKQAEQEARLIRLEEGQHSIAVKIGAMDTQQRHILEYVMPFWERLKKRLGK